MCPTHDPEATRARILDAAEEAFGIHGYEGARVDGIATAAQVNKRMLYHYFGDKAGLYDAVVNRLARRVLAEMEHSFEEAQLQDPVTALAHLLEVFFDAAHHEPYYVKIFAREGADEHHTAVPSTEGKQHSAMLLEAMEAMFQRVLPVLQRGVDRGVLRDDLDLTMVVVLGILTCRAYLLALPRLDALDPRPLQEPEGLLWAKRHIVALLVDGLRTRTLLQENGSAPLLADAENGAHEARAPSE